MPHFHHFWELDRPATLVVGGYGGIGGLTTGANPLERLNKEIKRHTEVVGVVPNPEALLRLAGSVLVEACDEWQAGERRYLSEGSMTLLATQPPTQRR
jgi:Transposase, Mutator family